MLVSVQSDPWSHPDAELQPGESVGGGIRIGCGGVLVILVLVVIGCWVVGKKRGK